MSKQSNPENKATSILRVPRTQKVVETYDYLELPLYLKDSKEQIGCGGEDIEFLHIDEDFNLFAVRLDSFKYASITSDVANGDSVMGFDYKSSQSEFELARAIAIEHFQTGKPVYEIAERMTRAEP